MNENAQRSFLSDGVSELPRQLDAATTELIHGIIHDLNNVLAIAAGNAAIALKRLNDDCPANPHLERIVRSITKAAELNHLLIDEVLKNSIGATRVDVNAVLLETTDLFDIYLGAETEFALALETESGIVWGNHTQLQQVFLNLLINAAAAIGSGYGRISVSTYALTLAVEQLEQYIGGDDLSPGLYFAVDVQDSGQGISTDILPRIFESQFTTKPDGLGIGLSSSLEIVTSHGGAMHVVSVQSVGSRFRVILPLQAD